MAKKSTTQINSVNTSAPTVGAITKFFQDTCAAIQVATPEKLGIAALAAQFADDVEALAQVQNKQRASSAGLELTAADERRDAIISFLFRYFTLMKDSPNASKAAAGARLDLLARSYPDLAYVEMTRETTLVDGLLRDLADETREADIELLQVSEYIEALDDAQADFKAADAARQVERQTRAEIAEGRTSKELRAACIAQYKPIVQLVNAMALIQPSAEITAFVSTMNAAIANLEQVIATEKAANSRQAKVKQD